MPFYSYHDGVAGKSVSDFLDEVDEELGVAVGHVEADELHLRHVLHDGLELLKVGFRDAGKI